LVRGERLRNTVRHAQLLSAHTEVRQSPLERSAMTEYVFKIQHVVMRPRSRLRRILRGCRPPVETHICMNSLRTGVQRRIGRQWGALTSGNGQPGIYMENARMATAAHTMSPLPQLSRAVTDWVNSVRELTQPRAIHWCEGTETEARELTAQLLRNGE